MGLPLGGSMALPEIKYAVYPGSVTLYNGTIRTFTAAELAAAYGVSGEAYLTVNSDLDLPRDYRERMQYIELRPRQDNIYRNIKEEAQDDDAAVTWGPNFDGNKKYTDETDPQTVDRVVDV